MTPQMMADLLLSALEDIHVPGFIDDEGLPVRFWAQLRELYLELSGKLLQLQCIEDTGTVSIRIVDRFSPPPYLDDDQTPCVMSIREMVLEDPDARNTLSGIRLWGAAFGVNGAACSAAQFDLEGGQGIFVDPSYHFGMRIGGSEQRGVWLRNWPGAAGLEEWSVRAPDSER